MKKPIERIRVIIEHMKNTNPFAQDYKQGRFIYELCLEIIEEHLEKEFEDGAKTDD